MTRVIYSEGGGVQKQVYQPRMRSYGSSKMSKPQSQNAFHKKLATDLVESGRDDSDRVARDSQLGQSMMSPRDRSKRSH